MRYRIWGAIALAIALVAHAAAAHELACRQMIGIERPDLRKLLERRAAWVLDEYPVAVSVLVEVKNVHPTQASTALSFSAPFLAAVDAGFGMATPFTLAVGQSKTAEATFTIASYEECLALARESGHLDGIILSTVAVGWELGEAQCNAELICKPQICVPGRD